jgi:hypothetical protein
VAPAPHRRSLAAKLFASIAVLGAAASCAGLGTFADPASARGTLSIGTGARAHLIALARVLQPATKVAPGDRVSRAVTLTARGRSFRRLDLKITAKNASLLMNRATGLRVSISRCAKQWRRTGERYLCRGKAKIVLKPVPVLGSRRLPAASIKRGKKLFLLVTLTFPAGAGNEFQHQQSTLTYKFTGR